MTNNSNLIDYTKDGKCSCCGQCCSNYLPMTDVELKHLISWAKKHRYQPLVVEDTLDVTCPFLDKTTSKCVCYDVRPEVCRRFTCKSAISGSVHLSKPDNCYIIRNLRRDIFNDPNTINYAEFVLLMDYIQNRSSNSR